MLGVLMLSIGLAMDATAVAAAKGLGAARLRVRDTTKMALLFGAFQAGMPLLGWAIGFRFAKAIEAWDHWVAFVLLGGIGAKMIVEALRRKQDDDDDTADPFGWWSLVVLAVATSIDALIAGLTLPLMAVPILLAVTSIGVTTAVLSAAGAWAGRQIGARLGRKLDVFGGLLLVGLGTKILIEHLSAR
jgi:putative Mn2+ efflux pump MntP